MRRLPLLAALSALALAGGAALTGCSSAGGAQSEGAETPASVALPEIVSAEGKAPEMVPVEDAEPPTELIVEVLEDEVADDADGDEAEEAEADEEEAEDEGAVVEPNSVIAVNYSGWLWDGTLFDSSFTAGEPIVFGLNNVIQGWKVGLTGREAGERVLLVIPPDLGYGAQGTGNIPANSTLVFVVDILDVLAANTDALEEATPTEDPLPEGLEVEGDLGSEPTLKFASDAPDPEEEEMVVLAEGEGPVLTADQTVVYNYTAYYWGEPVPATSTWSEGAEAVPAGNSLFMGERVGSRLVFIFPSVEGDQPAMVMVVDILDSYTP